MDMDTAICFTQYFVDKQNIRSYGNLVKLKLLKDEHEALFLINIFEDECLVSALTPHILEILATLRENLMKCCKHDFKNYFPHYENKALQSLKKGDVFIKCWDALCDIIPKCLYGNRCNQNYLKKLVEVIIQGMKRQHLLFGKIIAKWDFSVHAWNSLEESWRESVLYHILLWIIKNILSPMISLNFHVTTCKIDADENKLHFFWKHQWQTFYDKTVHKMICHGIIRIYIPYCMGRKYKQRRNLASKMKLRTYKKYIPKLHLVLKAKNDCRPIVRCRSDILTVADRYKIKDRLIFLKLLTGKSHEKVEKQFSQLYSNWLSSGKPKLYFIRTDLSNAFGCVDREKLNVILQERYRKYEHEEKNKALLERNLRLYKSMVTELQKPLLIRAGSTVYEWKKGLVQGYKYSPALSELYYTHLDEIYFSAHIKISDNDTKLFLRQVDDYLYVTDSFNDAEMFLKALFNYENVNCEKTEVNFSHPTIKYSDEITFLGYCYNTVTMQVRRAENIFMGQMCYKITFNSTVDNIYTFLETRLSQSSIQIHGHLFNFMYNIDVVWNHIFTTFCLSANKFCTILAVLCDGIEMQSYLQLYKKKVTVKLSNTIIEVLMKHKPNEFRFMYCINHFRYISWLALYLCARQTPKCMKLLPQIKDEMAKSNCLFGKWRDHASRIDTNGNILQGAIKAVCRRSDLRLILESFDTLPKGFQCYNYKLILNQL